MVVVCRIVESVRVILRQCLPDGGMKIDVKKIYSDTELGLDGYGITDKHVIGFQQQCSIEVYIGVCVKAFKNQLGVIPFQLFGGNCKSSPVFPVFIFHPLNLLFIDAIKRIGKLFMVDKILMNGARNLCRSPQLRPCLGKLPACI